MAFPDDLDALLAKVQARVDAAMSGAREELKEMAIAAEKDWSELRQQFSEGCCESPKTPTDGAASHSETSTSEVGDQPPG